jgi:hypothetical protein
MDDTELLYTGDHVQVDGEIGRVQSYHIDAGQRKYEVQFPDGRTEWYARSEVALVRKMIVEPRPKWAE